MNHADDIVPPDSYDPREGDGTPDGHAEGAMMKEMNEAHEPEQPDQFSDEGSLHPQDADALDSLVHAAFRIERVEPDKRPVAQVLAGLLSLLDRGPSHGRDDGGLIDLTMARIARARHLASQSAPDVSLSPSDDDALESLVSAGYDPQRVTPAIRARAAKAASLLGLLAAPIPPEQSTIQEGSQATPLLVDRTLARVQRAIEEHEESMALTSSDRRDGGGRWAFRLQDLISVAALLLVAASLIGPMLIGLRESNRRLACGANMQAAGVAFGQYGNDSKGMLPIATSSKAGNPWWFVGQGAERSNSANLYVLNRANFTTVEKLACCGNPNAPKQAPTDAVDWGSLNEVSYSYQCQFAAHRSSWKGGTRVVILSDASPVVRRAVRGEIIYPFENSPNHGGTGQNVLFNDGSGEWLKTPVVETGRSDNIWLPRRIECEIAKLTRPNHAEALKGNESPDAEDDSFVGP